MDINQIPLSEFDSLFDAELNKPHIQEWADGFALYLPVAYRDEHGTVLAHLVMKSEDGLETWKFYSRGWGFWNFADHSSAKHFELADEAIAFESYLFHDRGDVDRTIQFVQGAIDVIKHGEIPDSNPEFQRLVVSMAYNAITEDSEFIRIVKDAGLKPFDVQLMIDRAMIRILGNRNFRLEDSVLI